MEYSTKRAERLKQACNQSSYTGKESGIPFPTEKLAFKPVYRIPIKILSFNFDNGRIASEKITKESQRGKKFNPNSEEDQKLVGEILLTSVDREGTRKGFDIPLVKAVSEAIDVPVIASGGMGKLEDFLTVVKEGCANAVAMADILHYKRAEISDIRAEAEKAGLDVRYYEIA